MKTLLSHQKKIIAWWIPKQNAALFVDMRLGKTLMTIRRIKLWNCTRILIVAPYSAIAGWEKELQSENEPSIAVITGDNSAKAHELSQFKATWTIVNKEFHRTVPELKDYLWDCVVLDESDFIANPKAECTKYFLDLRWQKVRHRIILSGTPAEENPLQYFCQIKFLDYRAFTEKNYWEFRMNRFTPGKGVHIYDWKITSSGKTYLSTTLSKYAYTLKRKDVHLGGKKIYEQKYCQIGKEVRILYSEVIKSFAYEDKKTIFATQKFLWLRQFASGFVDKELRDKGKIDLLLGLLSSELRHQKVIIWADFIHELKTIQAFIPGTTALIYGETKKELREKYISDFQAGRGAQYLIAQPVCMQYGVNLSEADTMIYFSSPLGSKIRKQTEDRNITMSNSTSTLVVDLICKDTVDEDIFESQIRKESESEMMHRILKRIQK